DLWYCNCDAGCGQGSDGQKAGLPNRETGLNYGHSGMTGIHSGNPRVDSALVKDLKLIPGGVVGKHVELVD
ncbi:MAG: hypothetical protein OXF20_14715, partial [Gammaproteobacteria bacterium]|nr:hypothetical protein [Gammaproteobacteria bacterium]